MTPSSSPSTTPSTTPSTGRSTGRSTAPWRIVAEREVSVRVRDKAFLGATAFTLLLLVAFFVITSLVQGGPEEYDVAVTSADDRAVVALAETALQQETADTSVDAQVVSSVDAAERLVRDGEADAALLATDSGYELVGDEDVDTSLANALTGAVSQQAVERNAAAHDISVEELFAGTDVGQRMLDPNADESGARTAVAFAFAIVFLMTAMGFGMSIAQSVAQEKESRVVEILAAAVPIRSLLWGKIVGNTVLALGQIVLIVAVGLAGLAATGRGSLLVGVGPAVLWYVAFFVLGFLALAALWSVAGALASRQEDLQSTTMPGQLILFVPYIIAFAGSEGVKTVVSMLPIVSTMLMPGRMAEGDVPWWQVGVAIAATVAAAVVFVRVGTRMYERTLLCTGGKISYREAFKLSA